MNRDFLTTNIEDRSRQNAKADDNINEYETEYNDNSNNKEHMQLNPSADYYDDNEDIEENYDEADLHADIYDNEKSKPELLPEAKQLVQLSVNGRPPIRNKKNEEEDMGYDEDDERIAIAIERPKNIQSHIQINQDYESKEGSGSFNNFKGFDKDYSINDGQRFDFKDSFNQNKQITHTAHSRSDTTVDIRKDELRESSGNFANDDEDNEEDNDDDDDTESFFNIKRKSNSRYFRKNTNDAIKIISTPLGKVGIVYQQIPSQTNNKTNENLEKKTTSFTDFDALSPDPESSRRLASSHPKITPVLTPDGKVALLYRGDSENSKYEPIRNMTSHKFNEPIFDGKQLVGSNNKDSSESNEYDDADLAGDVESNVDKKALYNVDGKTNFNTKTTEKEQAAILHSPEVSPTTGSFIIRPTDSILPMINRPLSEVLGIKKNQFKQFRVKDTTTVSESLSESNKANSDTSSLNFPTKVNLADYSSFSRSRNYDFDFSRDNTMLDERSRNREEQINIRLNTNLEGHQEIHEPQEPMNEDILSKTEVVNLAIIPHFDEELERLQRLREYEERRHQRQRQKQNAEDLSGIHCIMQAMMAFAAISTVFGMLGTFFKQRILDQLRLMHW